MGREALQAAVANYRGEEWVDDHEEGALVCKCFAVDEVMIEETIRANNLRTVEEVTNYTKAGGGCSSCHEGIENILTRVLAEAGETFVPGGVAAQAQQAPARGRKMGTLARIRKIEEILDSIRPALQADKGDVELIDVEGNTIYVHLTGACTGCQMAAMTLGGIQQRLIEELGEFVKVVPAAKESLVSMGA